MNNFLQYDNCSQYVFKSVNDFIIILERLPDTITNEKRTNIPNDECRKYAKYRGNVFFVKDICHKFDNSIQKTSIEEFGYYRRSSKGDCSKGDCSNYYEICCIKYEIGQKVISENFHDDDYDLEKMYLTGIYFFLKLECAYYHMTNIDDGEYLQWYDNGQQHVKCIYSNGVMEGKYLSWYENGKPYYECFYDNDKKNGPYLEWYDSGQQRIKCSYHDGVFHGEYLEWNENGSLNAHHIYDNGIKQTHIFGITINSFIDNVLDKILGRFLKLF